MEEKNYPKEIRKVIKEIKKNNGYTEELGNQLASLISEGGWLYGILCFPVIPNVPQKVCDLNQIKGDYATIEYKADAKRFIPLYTNQDYTENLAAVTKLQGYEYACCRAVTVNSVIDKARECKITGVIINPQIEGITICLQHEQENSTEIPNQKDKMEENTE